MNWMEREDEIAKDVTTPWWNQNNPTRWWKEWWERDDVPDVQPVRS